MESFQSLINIDYEIYLSLLLCAFSNRWFLSLPGVVLLKDETWVANKST